MKILLLLLVSLYLYSCSGSNPAENYREQGLAIHRSVLAILKDIKTEEALQTAVPILSSKFETLAEIMVAAQKYHELHPEQTLPAMSKETQDLNAAYCNELNRIYRWERGRILLEKAQEKAVAKLELQIKKKNKRLIPNKV